MDLLRNIALVYFQYRHFQDALAELKRCSDRELAELGIARSDIARFAYEEAEQHMAALAPRRPETAPAAAGHDLASVPGR
jgi:uncharacterized protein YjiS (DUF1127 family)